MGRTILTIFLAVSFFAPGICFSSYLIELKNGGEFVTDEYWEENNHIHFYSYGGLVDLPKNKILSITESDQSAPQASVYSSDSVEPSTNQNPVNSSIQSGPDNKANANTEESTEKVQPKSTPKMDNQKTETGAEKIQKAELQRYRDKKDSLQALMEASLEELRAATKKRDKKAKEKAEKDVIKYSGEIYALTDEVKSKNNGELPDNWW